MPNMLRTRFALEVSRDIDKTQRAADTAAEAIDFRKLVLDAEIFFVGCAVRTLQHFLKVLRDLLKTKSHNYEYPIVLVLYPIF